MHRLRQQGRDDPASGWGGNDVGFLPIPVEKLIRRLKPKRCSCARPRGKRRPLVACPVRRDKRAAPVRPRCNGTAPAAYTRGDARAAGRLAGRYLNGTTFPIGDVKMARQQLFRSRIQQASVPIIGLRRAIPGKHRDRDAAWAALEDFVASHRATFANSPGSV